VGAFNVGRITVSFDDAIRTNRRGAQRATRVLDPPVVMQRGQELLTFHLGSTVVLVFEPGRVQLADTLNAGQEIRLGQPIARPDDHHISAL
jgi:phosphatidylserine decarboxylase